MAQRLYHRQRHAPAGAALRGVHAALALLLAAAGAKNHGDELALFVRQYAEKNDKKVDVHRLAAAADAQPAPSRCSGCTCFSSMVPLCFFFFTQIHLLYDAILESENTKITFIDLN